MTFSSVGFTRFTRPFTLRSADGGTVAQNVPGTIVRIGQGDELVGSVDQDSKFFVVRTSELQAAGFHPLPKYTQVIEADGSRTYAVQSDRDTYAGASQEFTKAVVKG